MTGDAQPRRDTLKRQREEMRAALDATIEDTIREGKTVTRDLGGSASTDEFTDAIIAKL